MKFIKLNYDLDYEMTRIKLNYDSNDEMKTMIEAKNQTLKPLNGLSSICFKISPDCFSEFTKSYRVILSRN